MAVFFYVEISSTFKVESLHLLAKPKHPNVHRPPPHQLKYPNHTWRYQKRFFKNPKSIFEFRC
ncbi:hypothetical protein LEP1GSC036_3654 [Leptospira weilii str. 2006001853]|uniref:Uncharacterized protein n=1 Tax=Leptospira weilii str. 2006001853 TaxID=1001589 RepID=A0A828Z3J8_9LEPT|nr:hypothetical protein LEP1GSC036_3654 [Leptospira weilii str. 2006001853]